MIIPRCSNHIHEENERTYSCPIHIIHGNEGWVRGASPGKTIASAMIEWYGDTLSAELSCRRNVNVQNAGCLNAFSERSERLGSGRSPDENFRTIY